MPEVHLPNLEEVVGHEETHAPAAHHTKSARSRLILKLALEVVLISGGVFLGLMGEQWRENTQHRELAETGLRNFRSEIVTNRAALAGALSYHQELRQHLREYFRTGQPVTNETLSKTFAENKWEWKSLYPIALQRSAWDLALATQALEYVDPEVAFTLSRVYTSQAAYDRLEDKATGAVYSSTATLDTNFRGFVQIVQSYLGDASIVEPALLKAYDDALPQINRALGEPSESAERAPK